MGRDVKSTFQAAPRYDSNSVVPENPFTKVNINSTRTGSAFL
jgi:hypothetical protein